MKKSRQARSRSYSASPSSQLKKCANEMQLYLAVVMDKGREDLRLVLVQHLGRLMINSQVTLLTKN